MLLDIYGLSQVSKVREWIAFFADLLLLFFCKSKLKEGICSCFDWARYWRVTDPRSNLGTYQYRPAWRWIRDSGESRQPASDLTCCWMTRKNFRFRSSRKELNRICDAEICGSVKASLASRRHLPHLDQHPSCCSRPGQSCCSSSLSRDPVAARDLISSRALFADAETESRWNRSEMDWN